MTFTSRFAGNETDRSGTASFSVGSIERDIPFSEFAHYHGVAQLLNEAYRVGREAAARDLLTKMQQWEGEMGAFK